MKKRNSFVIIFYKPNVYKINTLTNRLKLKALISVKN